MSLVCWEGDEPTLKEAFEFVRIGHPLDYSPRKTQAVVRVLLREMFAAEDAYGCGFYGEGRWNNAHEALRTISERATA